MSEKRAILVGALLALGCAPVVSSAERHKSVAPAPRPKRNVPPPDRSHCLSTTGCPVPAQHFEPCVPDIKARPPSKIGPESLYDVVTVVGEFIALTWSTDNGCPWEYPCCHSVESIMAIQDSERRLVLLDTPFSCWGDDSLKCCDFEPLKDEEVVATGKLIEVPSFAGRSGAPYAIDRPTLCSFPKP